ncbi:MAG: Gfo/Idh/MocA family oxidoreductase, partial [Phycisphaeraceae bacterium]
MATLALIGAAHIHTPNFVKKMAERADVTVKYVWDHDAARAAKNASQLPGASVMDLDTILADKSVSAAVVCSETIRHEELVPAICKKKKHLFVEKPLGIGSADSKKMLKAIEKARVLFQTG